MIVENCQIPMKKQSLKLPTIHISNHKVLNDLTIISCFLITNLKEFVVLQSMISLRKSGLGYRKISDEIKNKFGKRIYFPQVHKILNRPHNRQY